MKPRYFKDQEKLRDWFEKYHADKSELWLGYFKKASGKDSVTWSESVDQALCFGWIDGLRKSIDAERYCIRFTPRRPRSIWSAVNIRKMRELRQRKLVTPAGRAAYAQRSRERSVRYAYEQKNVALEPQYEKVLRSNPAAWAFFEALPPSVLKPSTWWVMSAKKEETRLRRLSVLLECCAQGERIPQLRRGKK